MPERGRPFCIETRRVQVIDYSDRHALVHKHPMSGTSHCSALEWNGPVEWRIFEALVYGARVAFELLGVGIGEEEGAEDLGFG